jgi:3-(3-hydroxy-phenyl)propionate hydroxylase
MVVEFDAPRPADDMPVDEKELAASIRRLTGEEPALGEITWVSRFGSPTRLAERYRVGRVFLAGDAAHTLYISGTQGVNAGVQDAVNLGWKLAAHLNGWAPEGLLDTYHAERRAVGELLCHHSAASMALVHPLEHVAQLRELFSELIGLEDVNRYLLELPAGAHYPLDGAGDPLLGRPLPAAVPEIGGAAATLRAGRGLLLDLTGRRDSGVGELAAGWAGRVDVVTAAAPAGVPAAVLLARPDGYVAHADPTGADRDGLRTALRRWFGDPVTPAG